MTKQDLWLNAGDNAANERRKNEKEREAINEKIADLDLKPTGMDMVIQPMRNPYINEIDSNGFISKGDILLNPNSGELEKSNEAVGFALVHEVSENITRAKKGDLIFYFTMGANKLPFADGAFSILNECNIVTVISSDEGRNDVELLPTGSDLVIRPEKNPYLFRTTESGIILPELSAGKDESMYEHRKDDIEIKYGIVTATAPEVNNVNIGDQVYFYESVGMPVPFMDQDLIVVHESNLLCFIRKKERKE